MPALAKEKQVLLKHIDTPNLSQLSVYESLGGYAAAKKAYGMQPAAIIEEVKASGIRGRGGAGFPTGMKWGFVPQNTGKPIYLLCNADESEPGCFKDRVIIEKNPHAIVEGILIAARAINSHKSYIYIRGEYAKGARILQMAIDEAYQSGYLGKNIFGTGFDLDLVLHRGAGAYICGEETGLISSLEGKKGQPKLKPPFPAVSGYLGCPTVVNNVETLSTLPWVLTHGGKAYAGYGTEKSSGTRLFCLSGWVNKPGVYELELGTPMRVLIDELGGGLRDGAKLKAVIPGGSSTPPLTAAEVAEATLDFECMAKYGSFLGAGGVIVIPEHVSLLTILETISEFYWDESCGQCTPCREGTGWLFRILKQIHEGRGTKTDIEDLQKTAGNMMGTTICALADAAAMPVLGFLKKFPDEFYAALREREGQ
ncbi:MAG: NADH-quinone oxidoreductase subunit NuoF [Bdellovibrionales bacterium]|nr:NADH-quinone oxidoreductase subunit NuoF [Bdellovibrionales bacterium]